MILLVHLVLLLEGHMTDGLVLVDQQVQFLLKVVAGILQERLELFDDGTFLLEVLMLLATLSGSSLVACLEEMVAGTHKLLPQLVAQFLGHHTDGLPLLLQGNELIASGAPLGRVLEGVGLLDKRTFLVGILLEGILEVLEILCLTGEETVAGGTETLKDLHVHLLWSETDGLPLRLDIDDLLGMFLPVGTTLVLLGSDSLYLLAERRLTGEVLLLLGTDIVEMLLMALVDDRRGRLETVPYLLTQFLGHRTDLTELLMELL